MKKSKLLVPAIALLCFSTVAAVTGTVAWFTSTSAVQVKTTSFQVKGLEGNLAVTMKAGVGTTKATDTEITAKSNATLTHGSFDIEKHNVFSYDQESPAGKQYFVNRGDIVNATGAASVVDTPFMENDVQKIYNAFSWSMTFSYGTDESYDFDRNLYFDVDTVLSNAVPSVTIANNNANAARAFRIAFVSDDANAKVLVWSPLNGTKYWNPKATPSPAESDVVSSYVKTSDTDAKGVVTALPEANLLYKDEEITKINGGDSATSNRKDYMGTFTATKHSITITCVAYFEGSDEFNILDDTSKPSVSTSMNFYVRRAATEAQG